MKRNILVVIWSIFISIGTLFAQDFPTIGEVYNYEIGDVFHIVDLHKIQASSSEDYWDSTIKVLEVTHKVYSVDHDTVCYQVLLKSKQFSIEHPDPVYDETYYDLCYTNLDQEFLGDTLLQNSDDYNDHCTKQRESEFHRRYFHEPIVGNSHSVCAAEDSL